MFRRLYWIVEQVDAEGRSTVTGVYTSIPDLIHTGLQLKGTLLGKIRLSLWKPDDFGTPLGSWEPESFGQLPADLQVFVKTNEYTPAEVADLVGELKRFLAVAA